MSSFKTWTQVNPSANATLRPDLITRSYGSLSGEEKKNIFLHFSNKGWFDDSGYDKHVHAAVRRFNDDYKAKNFCPKTLAHGGPHHKQYSYRELDNCCIKATSHDFYNIFLTETTEVVYQLVTYFVQELPEEKLERFKNCFNDISNQFQIDVQMLTDRFIPRQEEKLISNVYEPVFSSLTDIKWKEVNNHITDALTEYQINTPQGYSSCMTNLISALQAFLQILVNGKTGKGEISVLIKKGQKNGLIPGDYFTETIFSNLNSYFARERKEASTAHPKIRYADEKTARLMLNLLVVFIQHCMQHEK